MAQQTFSGVPDDRSPGDVIRAADADKVREFILSMIVDGTQSTTGNVMPLLMNMSAGEKWLIDANGTLSNANLAATSTEAFRVRVSGNTNNRLRVYADGKIEWGSGTATPDTNLYRDSANLLKTDDGLEVAGTLTTGTKVVVADGTVSAPSVTNTGDTDTGLYFSAANTVSVACAGEEQLRITDGTVTTANSAILKTSNGSAADPGLQFGSSSDGIWHDSGTSQLKVVINGSNEYIFGAGGFVPAVDNANTLGDGSFRWQEVFAANGTINTSDVDEKTDIVDDDLGLEFVRSLRPRRYRWRDGERPHYGFVAQEVESVLSDRGTDFGGFVDPSVAGGSGPKGLRYSEFIGPLVAAVQELAVRLEAVEGRRR